MERKLTIREWLKHINIFRDEEIVEKLDDIFIKSQENADSIIQKSVGSFNAYAYKKQSVKPKKIEIPEEMRKKYAEINAKNIKVNDSKVEDSKER